MCDMERLVSGAGGVTVRQAGAFNSGAFCSTKIGVVAGSDSGGILGVVVLACLGSPVELIL